MSDIVEKLKEVRGRISRACERVGRDPEEVAILAVAKTFGPSEVRLAAEAGLRAIGENRVQEAKQKIPLCSGMLKWHLIGHLQSNKVRDAVGLFQMIHSVDSLALMQKIDGACRDRGVVMPICLQVNVSGEGAKFGLRPEDVLSVLLQAGGMMNVEVVGMMTIPPISAEAEAARPFFAQLRILRDECQQELGAPLPELSMGMTHDFEVAVEEGATWIRLGRYLFGKR